MSVFVFTALRTRKKNSQTVFEFHWTREPGHWFHWSADDYGAESAKWQRGEKTPIDERGDQLFYWAQHVAFSWFDEFPRTNCDFPQKCPTAATTEAAPIKTTTQLSWQSSKNMTERDMDKLDAHFFIQTELNEQKQCSKTHVKNFKSMFGD